MSAPTVSEPDRFKGKSDADLEKMRADAVLDREYAPEKMLPAVDRFIARLDTEIARRRA